MPQNKLNNQEADMRYVLMLLLSGHHPKLELMDVEYYQIRDAQAGVRYLLQVEELFNLVLGNYVDFEKTLLDVALECSVYQNSDYKTFHGYRYEVERRILNLLSAGRSYLDQAPQRIEDFMGSESAALKAFRDETHTQYDSSLGYRVMECLRNYVQHRGLPVGKLSVPCWVDQNAPEHRLRTTITPYLMVSRLEEDGGFKKIVLDELRAMPNDDLDLKPFIRDYVAALGKVHLALRDTLASTQAEHIRLLNETVERYRQSGAEHTSPLAIAYIDKNGIAKEHFPIFLEAVNQLEWLQQRSRHLEHLRKISVSSEIYGER